VAIEPSGTDPTNLWTAIAGGLATAIALGVTAFSQHIWKKREAIERPVDYEIAQGEIADMRPARKLVNELGPKLENMYSKMEIMMDRADGREGVGPVPLMAAYEQNDARDSARLLAVRTLEGLEGRHQSELVSNAINNLYRLLIGYRSHGFYGCAEPVRSDDDVSMTAMLTSTDRNVSDLRSALDKAFESAFGNQDVGRAINHMKVVLRTAAYPADSDLLDQEALVKTKQFLQELLKNLGN
jgi:hypothetical protein